jgi:hypothetical protein
MNLFHKITLYSLALASALAINAMEAKAKPLIRLIPAADAPAWYTDKVDALVYISEELRVTDPGCRAYESLLRYEREIRSGKAEPSAVREMAKLYRAGQHNPKGDPIGDIIERKLSLERPAPAVKPTVKPTTRPIQVAAVVKPKPVPARARASVEEDAGRAAKAAQDAVFAMTFGG